jgi:glycosyltransferase involved in cell wall biosynthesis
VQADRQKRNVLSVGTLSICMIVKNESQLLGRCLESIRSEADEIIVVDTGSTDSTVEVAKGFGSKVIEVEWKNDFAWARNISLERATCQWILWLDADDIVPVQSLPIINRLKKGIPDKVLGFIVRNQRPNNTGTEFVQARMFPNRADIYFERKIHEQMMPSALKAGMEMEKCDAVVEHHGYADPATLKKKALRNVNLLLEEYRETAADAVSTVEIADSFYLVEDFASAKEWYKKTLQITGCEKDTPTIAGHAYYGLGNIYNYEQQYKEALSQFEKALCLAPWRVDVLYSKAVSEELAGFPQLAVKTLNQLLEIKPDPGQVGVDFRSANVKARLRLLRLLVDLKRSDEALNLAEKSIALLPDRPEVFNMAGKVYIKAAKLIDALHSFEKSLSIIREGNIEAYIGLCIVYQLAGAKDKINMTIKAIEPLFRDDVRYKVFKIYSIGDSLPADLTEEDFNKRILEIRRDFFGVF